jgi:peptide/nickel transport system substrate-binding protein
MQSKEMDWWENPTNDMLPVLQQSTQVRIIDPTGLIACMRPNELWPPFDNPAIRRAMLKGIDQREYMEAIAGTDANLWHVPAGIFTPGMPMASTAGLCGFWQPCSLMYSHSLLPEQASAHRGCAAGNGQTKD